MASQQSSESVGLRVVERPHGGGIRYFTKKWFRERPGDFDRRCSRYQEHLTKISVSLPIAVREFIAAAELHDGIFRRCTLSEDLLELRLIVGDLQQGYSDLRASYANPRVRGPKGVSLRRIFEDPQSEVLYDEFHLRRGAMVHAFLLWPGRELEVEFSDMSWSLRSRRTRRRSKGEPVLVAES